MSLIKTMLNFFNTNIFGTQKKDMYTTMALQVSMQNKFSCIQVVKSGNVRIIAYLTLLFCAQTSNAQLLNKAFANANLQCKNMLLVAVDPSKPPRNTKLDGNINLCPNIYDWTSGFFAGNLWYAYEATKDDTLKLAAIRFTEALDSLQYFTGHHDVGFMVGSSYGNGYRLTHNEKYKAVLVQTAKSLCTRFNPNVGCIKSWNQNISWDKKTIWHYPVIVDNMMNLELLFLASRLTGDTTYRHIAVTHALTTMKNHIRPDYSTYHVVDYDTKTGKPLHKETHQGYANNSTWARGEAWGIYGFTMVYRETGDKRFLETAQHMADFFLNNPTLPQDKIPLWDFNVNQVGYQPLFGYDSSKYSPVPRDASAAAIVASALFDLSKFSGKKGEVYRKVAIQILNSLASDQYTAKAGTNNSFILKHSTGSLPHGADVDKPLVYADYYYLEALLKYQKSLK